MNGTTDRSAAASWIQRAHAVDGQVRGVANDCYQDRTPRPAYVEIDWSPIAAWMSRIDRPRRHPHSSRHEQL